MIDQSTDRSLLTTCNKRTCTQQEVKKEDFAWTAPLRGRSICFGTLSRRGLNPVKLVYRPRWPDGQLNLTASDFNQLGLYTSGSDRIGPILTRRTRRFLPLVAVTVASTQCAHPQSEGQAESTLVAIVRWLITSPSSTNRDQCRVSSLTEIETNALYHHVKRIFFHDKTNMWKTIAATEHTKDVQVRSSLGLTADKTRSDEDGLWNFAV